MRPDFHCQKLNLQIGVLELRTQYGFRAEWKEGN